ncbi:MAG: glycerol-3-phosphate dehydrogenase/oxidase [Proteobacteria bacterium]|nr:glycerol-3-phosphate dehydrogenase/oxidase [Pseudomonadota bacterium]
MTIAQVERSWDVIVIGGGVTGAATFHQAARMGLRAILIEQNDFAWGTSSRSSKMVHGGLRYLKEGKLLLTRASVKERERMLAEAPGLVDPLGFLMPVYTDYGPSKTTVGIGLSIYSFMALKKQHISYNAQKMKEAIPYLRTANLAGGFYFEDAQVDDARLVLRLINEGVANGGEAINYTRVREIHRDSRGYVSAITAEDVETNASAELKTKAVINATGVWAENLHLSPEQGLHIRPLRGSHLIFPRDVYPIDHTVSFTHPRDKRPVFMFPWEGTAVLGTTDVDHRGDINTEPAITSDETAYLMEGLEFIMPGLGISEADCIATFAGIRPVLSKGKASASRESREHTVWEDRGLVTVTGGKLTTFRLLARDALKAALKHLPQYKLQSNREPVFDKPIKASAKIEQLDRSIQKRLYGRYGNMADTLVNSSEQGSLTIALKTSTLWAELIFVAKNEQVRHLSDLLLRRTRIGLLLPKGATEHLSEIEQKCKHALSWDADRWETEKKKYIEEWQCAYAPPDRKTDSRRHYE